MDNELITRYKQLKSQIATLTAEQDDLKAELFPLVEASGGKLIADNGKATIISETSRITFDTDRLKALMERPDYEWLKEYAKTSVVKAQLRIT